MMLWQDETPTDRLQAAHAAVTVTATFREPVSRDDEAQISEMIARAGAASVWYDETRALRIVRTYDFGRLWH